LPVDVEPFGDAALRVRVPAAADAGVLLDCLRGLAGVVDAVVAEDWAIVTFEPGRPPRDVSDAVERAAAGVDPRRSPHEHIVRIVYDGPDLVEVAASSGLSPADVAKLHAASLYRVVAVGFLPGFAYLGGLDARLVAPRRATPRVRVPACALAIAGPYTGVYPFESPGGWNLIGTAVGFAPFTATAGAALALGDVVRFVQVEP
jgi:UPF0271 protein